MSTDELPQPDPVAPGDPQLRAEALAYCIERIDFYQGFGLKNYGRWKIYGCLAIIFGAVGTALTAFNTDAIWMVVVRTVVVATTTVLSAVVGFFSFQKEGVRQLTTADLLRGEKIKFETQATPYDKPDAVNLFVNNVRDIVKAENQAFASVMLSIGQGGR